MKRMPTLLRAANQTSESSPALQEQIRRRAHELDEQRGGQDGHKLADWPQAESEVTHRKAKTATA